MLSATRTSAVTSAAALSATNPSVKRDHVRRPFRASRPESGWLGESYGAAPQPLSTVSEMSFTWRRLCRCARR